MSVAAGELANNFKGLRESSPKFTVYTSQAQDYMKTLQPLASVSEDVRKSLNQLAQAKTPKAYESALNNLRNTLKNLKGQSVNTQKALNGLGKVKGKGLGSVAKNVQELGKKEQELIKTNGAL
jgi:prefoldin subunit 5